MKSSTWWSGSPGSPGSLPARSKTIAVDDQPQFHDETPSPAKPPSTAKMTRHEIAGHAYLIYLDGVLSNVLGCLTEREVVRCNSRVS